jgi:hypothetical protein
MPESVGGGCALFDMDGDGDLDAYLIQAGDVTAAPESLEPSRLLENLGDGTFRDVSPGSGAAQRGFGMGVACGDYDNDGLVDLYVTRLGPNLLLRNLGGGRFEDVTAAAGVGDPGWGSGCAFFDFDRDGDLDLVVLNYLNWSAANEITCYNDVGAPDYCLPTNYNTPARSRLYRNQGDGRFADVSDGALPGAVGTALGVVCGDFNGDGWPDIFIANDSMPDQLWYNRRDGTFVEMGMQVGAALDQEGIAKAGMGVAADDLDDDRDLDVLVCNLHRQSDSLFLNQGTHFRDSTILAGLSGLTRRFTRFGVGFADFDNDGFLDLYQANGRVQQRAEAESADRYAEPNTLLRGGPGPRFSPVEPAGGTSAPLVHTSRGAAFGDIDNDGGVDVLVVNRDGPAYLLRNVVPGRGHWILLRLLERHGRDAIGAVVEFDLGQRTLRREVRAAYSYLASNDPRVHVGLGAVERVDGITVTWPQGAIERFGPIAADRITVIREGAGAPVRPSAADRP